MSEIVDFLSGGFNRNGLTVKDILNWTPDRLERVHSYIQFLFPLNEPSKHNLNSPVLTPEDIEAIKNNSKACRNIKMAYYCMLNFYGFWYDNFARVQKCDDYEEIKKYWQTPNNHNYLRITRILKCLMLFGFGCEAREFYKTLVECYKESLNSSSPEERENFTKETIEYWTLAVHGVQAPWLI